MSAVSFLFFLSLAVLIYVNFGYMAVVFLAAGLLNKKIKTADSPFYPNVTIMISAYNEEDVIRKKIRNVLEQNYPKDKLQLLVGSDDSTDRTNEIVSEFVKEPVRLVIVKPRRGKTNVMNHLAQIGQGEIFVFTDANVFFEKDALFHLVQPFIDKTVGCTFGKVLPQATAESATAFGGGLYWRMEEKLKKYESMIGSSIGATGAIFALRRELYEQYPVSAVPDFVPSMNVILKGYRLFNVENAIVRERMATRAIEEFKRKRRIAARSLLGLFYLKELLNPFKYPVVSFQIFSHKILRWFGFLFIVLAFITNLILAYDYKGLWLILLSGQLLFYLLAIAGYFTDDKKIRLRFFAVPYYLLLANLSAFCGVIDFILGKVPVVWDTAKSSR